MKSIRLLVIWFTAAAAVAVAAGPQSITREKLERSIFQSMQVERGARPELLLQFRRTGERFLIFRNGKEEKVNAYGETIRLKPGESLSLSEQHGGLGFRPLPKPLDGNGWLLELVIDTRSFGGEQSSRYAIVLILNGAELRFVEPDPNFDPELPATDPTYQRIVKLVEQATLVSSHSLHADTAGGKATTPFPASATKLVFEWKLSPGASGEPIEIRWIAADTGGVAPKDHVISSSKSEPGKTAGAFTLTKPTSGFPAGKYRIELRQADKLIYQEDFSIQ